MAKQLPSKTKYRKVHSTRKIKGKAKGGDYIAFGEFAMQSLGSGVVTANQIEAVRVAINRHLKRKGKVWLRVFPHKPVTKKPAETRMGKGKGGVEYWAAIVKPGTILAEVSGVSMSLAQEAMRLADHKLAVPCRFISREEQEKY